MSTSKIREMQDMKIRRAMTSHEEWKSKWSKKDCIFHNEWVSPKGKSMTYSAYCYEVNRHMARTIERIRKIFEVAP